MAIDLAVRGAVPPSLSGQYVWISDGIVHAVGLGDGRTPSYRSRPTTTAATAVISFGGSLLAFGDGQLAFELDDAFDAVRPVDLAGARRTLAAHPALDPVTGELHLLTFATDPAQLHVRVSPGGLTRTVRSIDGAPGRIGQLALTRDHVVLLGGGFVGLMERSGYDARATWFPIDTAARQIAAARAFASPLVFVADPERPTSEEGGWLVGLVRDATADRTDFVVLDAQAIERPTRAVARLPGPVPDGARGTWVPGMPQI